VFFCFGYSHKLDYCDALSSFHCCKIYLSYCIIPLIDANELDRLSPGGVVVVVVGVAVVVVVVVVVVVGVEYSKYFSESVDSSQYSSSESVGVADKCIVGLGTPITGCFSGSKMEIKNSFLFP